MRAYMKSFISFLVALTGSDAIFTALDIDYHIFRDVSNAGKFVVYIGVVVGLFRLTIWLLERLRYFSNKRGA